ncbi:immune inhibitor A [Candidatus Binatia bacterium]|nr:immune inhibitor A [Candidatus Binatia bacterium]
MTHRHSEFGTGRQVLATAALAVGWLILLATAPPAAAQECTGDCGNDHTVTIEEVVTMVNIALGTKDIEICPLGDVDGNGEVTIDEIVKAVALTLSSMGFEARGTCTVPGTTASAPEKPCADGTVVRVYRCLDRARCLEDEDARRVLGRTEVTPGSEGAFAFTGIADCYGGTSTFLFEAEPQPEKPDDKLRVIDFGVVANRARSTAVTVVDDVQLSPITEATVRLVDENGLENFGQETFDDLLEVVTDTIDPASLVGQSPGAAAAAATTTAREDADVQAVIATVLRHDVPASTSIDPRGNVDLYKLTLHEQTAIVLQMTRSSGAIAPCLQVVSPSDPSLNESACGDPSVRLSLRLGAGTYYVFAEDEDGDGIGSYDLVYLRLTREDATAIGGDVLSEAIGPLGDMDPYSFTLAESSQVRLRGTRAAGSVSPCLELRALGATEALAGGTACSEEATQQVEVCLHAGTYIALVSDAGNNDEGSYNLQLTTFPRPGCQTPGATATPTPSPSRTTTPSATPTRTATPTPSNTAIRTAAPTATRTTGGSGTVLRDDLEQPDFWEDWAVSNGSWQWGIPSSGPGTAHQGDKLIATVLDGNYGDDTSSRIERLTKFVVPDATQNPRLRFWHWYNFGGGDLGRAQIKAGDSDWQTLEQFSGYSGGTWSYTWLDLSAYAGQTVQLGFYFESHGYDDWRGHHWNVSSGWYIDELEVVTGATAPLTANVVEGFESTDFWSNWSVQNGTWQWGKLESGGPGLAHEGENVIATVLNGDYGDDTSSRLVSPVLVVPAAEQNPRLRFWHWYNFGGGDFGRVQIKAGDSDWQTLAEFAGHSSGTWSYPSLDLSAYAGQTVRVGLYFESHGYDDWRGHHWNVSSGWYIDELKIRVD